MKRRLRLSARAWQRLAKKIDGAKIRINPLTRLSYRVSGAAYSWLDRLQCASHSVVLETAYPSPPLFLLGFWRSGTTFLHELFCCDSRFGFPSTYACLNPSHFLLTESHLRKSAAHRTVSRPMDNMRYSWASPQEDEFALLALGAPSAYEALLVPSLMRSPRALLALSELPNEERESWRERLLYFLRLLTAQQNKPMVLKSPTHGFRLRELVSMFPEAHFVIIERNPYEVFVSNLKLWRALLDMYSLEPAVTKMEEIETFVLAAYILHEEAIAEGTRHLESRTCARVRYEDLVADPLGQMSRLYAELELGDIGVARDRLEQHVASVSDYARNQFQLSLIQKSRVDDHWGELTRAKAYKWPDRHILLTKESGISGPSDFVTNAVG